MRKLAVCVGALALGAATLVAGEAVAQEGPVRFQGEVRVRHEMERPVPTDAFDQLTFLRTRLGVAAVLGDGARAFVQLQDARVFGEETSTLGDASADQLDLHQGYLELARPVLGRDLTLRAGRQEIALGSERLVGAVGWSNTGRAFDGARVDVALGGGRALTLFAATLAEEGPRFTGDPASEEDDQTLLGLHLDRGPVQAWAYHEVAVRFRTFTGVDRTTLGGRVEAPGGRALGGWLEGSWQTGNQLHLGNVDQDIGAWFVGGRVAWSGEAGPLAGLAAGADLLSGDEDPADDSYGAFHTLYATNHKWYGYLDLFLDPSGRTGNRGLLDVVATARLDLGEDLLLQVDGHHFRTAAERVAGEERALGWELDLTLPVKLGPTHGLQLGYSLFRNGAAAPLAGLGDDGETWHWGYVQASVAFPPAGAR